MKTAGVWAITSGPAGSERERETTKQQIATAAGTETAAVEKDKR